MSVIVKERKQFYEQKQLDQDGLWKKVIQDLFEEFLLFFHPSLYKQIDFRSKPDFLDKELLQEIVDGKKGRRYADQLVKVQLKSGEDKWILVHIEVQGAVEADFPLRMFQYFYRIFDQHEEQIVAIAVHTSKSGSQKMQTFEYDIFGTSLVYAYNNYRLDDYTNEALAQSENIFSKVVLAAKALYATKNEVEKRYRFKRRLMRELLAYHQISRKKMIATLYFIDYLLQLPEELTKRLSQEISPAVRKERRAMEVLNEDNMPPTLLHMLMQEKEEGVAEGRIEGEHRALVNIVLQLTKEKFGDISEEILDEIKVADVEILNKIVRKIFDVTHIEEVCELLRHE